jgi:transcription elongation factor GreA
LFDTIGTLALLLTGLKINRMTSENIKPSTPHNCSLGEAATRYLISLIPENRLKAQQEINKFVRWYGEDRRIDDLTVPEVSDYSDQIITSASESSDKLEPVKVFLSYAYKQGLIKTKLSIHIKTKKTSQKLSSSGQNSQEPISLTTKGLADLKAELSSLLKERPRVVEEIRMAAADKDFRENAPLDAAKDRQGKLEARIKELESDLQRVVIIDNMEAANHKAAIGNTIILRDLLSGEQIIYALVDAREANPTQNKISVASPIGQALLNCEIGDKIEVNAPAGMLPFEIEDIK